MFFHGSAWTTKHCRRCKMYLPGTQAPNLVALGAPMPRFTGADSVMYVKTIEMLPEELSFSYFRIRRSQKEGRWPRGPDWFFFWRVSPLFSCGLSQEKTFPFARNSPHLSRPTSHHTLARMMREALATHEPTLQPLARELIWPLMVPSCCSSFSPVLRRPAMQ
jgi:hypothetical protein